MRSDERLSDAGAALLAERIKAAGQHLSGARDGEAGAIHHLRVHVRKIRAALSILTETVLDKKAMRLHQRGLKALYRALGEARDNDVLINRLGAVAQRRSLTAGSVDGLAKLTHAQRKKARRRLKKRLDRRPPARRFEKLAKAVANAESVPADDGRVHRRLVRHFLAGVLVARYERVLSYELAVPGPMPVLHQLRIAIKQLRYAIDFFGEPLGAAAIALDATLKCAQDQLGALHDHHVAIQMVDDFERKHGVKPALAEVRQHEDDEAARLLEEFRPTWEEITSGPFRRQLLNGVADALERSDATSKRLAVRRMEAASPDA